MKARAAESVNAAVEAWDLYAAGSFDDVLHKYQGSDSDEARQIAFLAALELQKPSAGTAHAHAHAKEGPFAALAEGMRAYKDGNFRLAAGTLGAWLLKKDYYTGLILRRFLHAGLESENYSLLYSVCRRFMDRDAYREICVEPLLLAAFFLGKHQEVVDLFEKYRECFRDEAVIQKVAFSLMHLGRYRDSERFLLFLYKKLTGNEYDFNYEEALERYQPLIRRIPELARKKKRTWRDSMDLGMAYMFDGRYPEAKKIFEALLAAREA